MQHLGVVKNDLGNYISMQPVFSFIKLAWESCTTEKGLDLPRAYAHHVEFWPKSSESIISQSETKKIGAMQHQIETNLDPQEKLFAWNEII